MAYVCDKCQAGDHWPPHAKELRQWYREHFPDVDTNVADWDKCPDCDCAECGGGEFIGMTPILHVGTAPLEV